MSQYSGKKALPTDSTLFGKNLCLNHTDRRKVQVDEETLSELKEAFELFDTGRNNSIDARELKAAMRAFGIEARKDDVRNSMKSIGKDVNETLVFEEFVKIMAPKLGKRDSKEEIEKIFRLFDEDSTGKISFKNLKKIAQEIGTLPAALFF